MSTNNEVEAPATVTFTMPASISVNGARGMTGTVDMTKATPEKIAQAIDYWYGVVTQRASAGVDGLDAKKKAEQEKGAQCESWEWSAGAGGGRGKMSDEKTAERVVLIRFFMGQDYKKAAATKAAKLESAWSDFILLAMSRALNRTDVTPEEVATELENQQPVIQAQIKAEVDAIKAERERNSTLATSGLSFGQPAE